MLCSGGESHARDYSPFEFTAKKLNDLQETADFDVWEVFENGINRGINQNMEERAEQGAFEVEEEE